MTDINVLKTKVNLRPAEVAELLDVSLKALPKLDIPFFFVGKRARRYRVVAVEKWMASHEVTTIKTDSLEVIA